MVCSANWKGAESINSFSLSFSETWLVNNFQNCKFKLLRSLLVRNPDLTLKVKR